MKVERDDQKTPLQPRNRVQGHVGPEESVNCRSASIAASMGDAMRETSVNTNSCRGGYDSLRLLYAGSAPIPYLFHRSTCCGGHSRLPVAMLPFVNDCSASSRTDFQASRLGDGLPVAARRHRVECPVGWRLPIDRLVRDSCRVGVVERLAVGLRIRSGWRAGCKVRRRHSRAWICWATLARRKPGVHEIVHRCRRRQRLGPTPASASGDDSPGPRIEPRQAGLILSPASIPRYCGTRAPC